MKKLNSETEILKEQIIKSLQELKAEEILSLDLRKIEDSVSDFYIICHGNSHTQVAALSDAVYKKVKDEIELMPKAQEGKASAHWVILDYFDVVVHIFYKEARQYYQLEELWSDAKTEEYK